jgi:poly-gamma-glutamate synthesis protein (capsule biosynthesis protein)
MRRLLALLIFLVIAAPACLPGAQNGAGSAATPTPSAAQPSATPTPSPAALTLSGLFHPSAPVTEDRAHVRTMIATGDVIPARLVNVAASQRRDFVFPFRPTADYVRNADLTFINLESPLLPGCQPQSTGMVFCGDVRFADGLKLIGTKVVNLANNHVYAGPDTERTKALLEQNGMKVATNLGAPVVVDVHGLKFAFIGCNAVTSGPAVDRKALQADIQLARQLADVVIVQFHWGHEYVRQPETAPGVAPDEPVELGHLAIDAGADMVVGNHPHWVQGLEVYKDHLITYAHGNYVFDQVNCFPSIGSDYRTYCSDDTRTSVVGTYTFYDKRLVAASWKPTFIDTNLQTQWADPTRSQQVLKTMEDASVELARKQGEPTS